MKADAQVEYREVTACAFPLEYPMAADRVRVKKLIDVAQGALLAETEHGDYSGDDVICAYLSLAVGGINSAISYGANIDVLRPHIERLLMLCAPSGKAN